MGQYERLSLCRRDMRTAPSNFWLLTSHLIASSSLVPARLVARPGACSRRGVTAS